MAVSDEEPSTHLLGASITYLIAVGPHQGRKVMTLQTFPDCGDEPFTARVGNVAGFSLPQAHPLLMLRIKSPCACRGCSPSQRTSKTRTLVPLYHQTGGICSGCSRDLEFNFTIEIRGYIA